MKKTLFIIVAALTALTASSQPVHQDYSGNFYGHHGKNGTFIEWKHSHERMRALYEDLTYGDVTGTITTVDTIEIHLYEKWIDYVDRPDTVVRNGLTVINMNKDKKYIVTESVYTSVTNNRSTRNCIINMDIRPGVTYTTKPVYPTDPLATMVYSNGKLVVEVERWYLSDLIERDYLFDYLYVGIPFARDKGVYVYGAYCDHFDHYYDAATWSKFKYEVKQAD